MRFIPTAVHGAIDYLVGAFLLIMPLLFGLPAPGWWIFPLLGVIAIVYSLATAYEWGLVRLLPMPAHLRIDAAFGLVMLVVAASLNLVGGVRIFAAVIGVAALFLAATTRTAPAAVSTGSVAARNEQ